MIGRVKHIQGKARLCPTIPAEVIVADNFTARSIGMVFCSSRGVLSCLVDGASPPGFRKPVV
jgi:hypothetical protein